MECLTVFYASSETASACVPLNKRKLKVSKGWWELREMACSPHPAQPCRTTQPQHS